MLKTAQFDCSAINEKCCRVDGEQGIYSDSFFGPTPGDLTAQESPSPGICYPRPKNVNARGSARGGGGLGAAGIDVICQKRVRVFHQGFQTPRNR